MQYEKHKRQTDKHMNLCTVKWAQCDKNPIQRTVKTAHLSVHNFSKQYNTKQF